MFCVIPSVFGILYFVHWYRKYTQTEQVDVLKSWLLKYRMYFFAMMIVSSSNFTLFKLLWSRCNSLMKKSSALFNIPLRHDQQVHLMRGKVINVLFEEMPLFLIQMYILFTTDANSNSNNLNRNSQLVVMIALLSTIIGFMMNAVQFCATREKIGESQMRIQNVVVRRPTRNLNILNHTIAKNFGEGHYHCRVFVCPVNKLQEDFILQFFHTDPNESSVKQRISNALHPYCDEKTEIFFIPGHRSIKLMENMLDINSCMDTIDGEFQIVKSMSSTKTKDDMIYIRFPMHAIECAEEFKNLFQSKILDPKSKELEYEKWYNIEQIRQHRGNHYGIDSTVESAKVARASTIESRISSSECALKTNPGNQTALPIKLKQSQVNNMQANMLFEKSYEASFMNLTALEATTNDSIAESKRDPFKSMQTQMGGEIEMIEVGGDGMKMTEPDKYEDEAHGETMF